MSDHRTLEDIDRELTGHKSACTARTVIISGIVGVVILIAGFFCLKVIDDSERIARIEVQRGCQP